MKSSLMLVVIVVSFAISGCLASKTKYVEIQSPTNLWMRGEAVATLQPGDVLKVVGSKTCRGGNDTCWWVKSEKGGVAGIVSADEMKHLHRVYEVENQE